MYSKVLVQFLSNQVGITALYMRGELVSAGDARCLFGHVSVAWFGQFSALIDSMACNDGCLTAE